MLGLFFENNCKNVCTIRKYAYSCSVDIKQERNEAIKIRKGTEKIGVFIF